MLKTNVNDCDKAFDLLLQETGDNRTGTESRFISDIRGLLILKAERDVLEDWKRLVYESSDIMGKAPEEYIPELHTYFASAVEARKALIISSVGRWNDYRMDYETACLRAMEEIVEATRATEPGTLRIRSGFMVG